MLKLEIRFWHWCTKCITTWRAYKMTQQILPMTIAEIISSTQILVIFFNRQAIQRKQLCNRDHSRFIVPVSFENYWARTERGRRRVLAVSAAAQLASHLCFMMAARLSFHCPAPPTPAAAILAPNEGLDWDVMIAGNLCVLNVILMYIHY